MSTHDPLTGVPMTQDDIRDSWEMQERNSAPPGAHTARCLLDLRRRVEALEAQQAPQPAPNHVRDTPKMVSAEQQARDMLEGMGIEDAQDFRASDLTGLANLIADAAWLRRRVKELESAQARCPHIVSSDEGTSYCRLAEQSQDKLDRLIEMDRAERQPTPPPAPAGGLVESLACLIAEIVTTSDIVDATQAARKVTRKVAAWLRAHGHASAASALEKEVGE